MPVIKSAIKKLRQDRKHERENDIIRKTLKESIRTAKKTKSGKSVAKAVSVVDKAAKKNIIHKNKAARMKSNLTKIAKPASLTAVSKVKTTSTQSAAKKKNPNK